jgi:hypothetical protein
LMIRSVMAEQIPAKDVDSFVPSILFGTKPDETSDDEKNLDVLQRTITSGGNAANRGSQVGSGTDKQANGVGSINKLPIRSNLTPPLQLPANTSNQTPKEVLGVVQQKPSNAEEKNLKTLSELKEAGPSPTTLAYQKKYNELQKQWKTQLNGKSLKEQYSLFFEQDDFLNNKTNKGSEIIKTGEYKTTSFDNSAQGAPAELSSGNLKTNAIKALMLRFLSDISPIDVPIDSIDVVSANVLSSKVTVDEKFIKSVMLNPALDAFKNKGKKIYASVLRLDGEGNGQYVVVVIDKDGKVRIIDPVSRVKPYKDNLLLAVVDALNKARTVMDMAFSAYKNDLDSNDSAFVNTGIAGPDNDNTKSGIYAFTYWAGLMKEDNIDAYKSINGAAAADANDFSQLDAINWASVYSRTEKALPSAIGLQTYEEDVRQWLSDQLTVK